MKLWEKNQPPNKKIDHFTVGKDREYDLHLAAYDCQASIAHAQMLVKSGILNLEEADKLVVVLNDLKNESEKGNFVIEAEFEDMHSKIEYVLTEKLGDLGKKIHTARSRNDQVLVSIHLYLKEEISEIKSLINDFFKLLLLIISPATAPIKGPRKIPNGPIIKIPINRPKLAPICPP